MLVFLWNPSLRGIKRILFVRARSWKIHPIFENIFQDMHTRFSEIIKLKTSKEYFREKERKVSQSSSVESTENSKNHSFINYHTSCDCSRNSNSEDDFPMLKVAFPPLAFNIGASSHES